LTVKDYIKTLNIEFKITSTFLTEVDKRIKRPFFTLLLFKGKEREKEEL